QPTGSYSSVPRYPAPETPEPTEATIAGTSPESHQAVRTIAVAPAQIATNRATPVPDARPGRCARLIAAATKHANASARTSSHLHGNCTNRSSGSRRHKKVVNGSISTMDMEPSAAIIQYTCEKYRRLRASRTAATVVTSITDTATQETFQLKAAKSGSFEWVNRKFLAGPRLSATTRVIWTQR